LSQMAILETKMVKIDQIFLPYIVNKDGTTLYELLKNKNFFLADESQDIHTSEHYKQEEDN
jgi:hypothetical protein